MATGRLFYIQSRVEAGDLARASPNCGSVPLSQLISLQLSGGCFRKLGKEFHPARTFESGELIGNVRALGLVVSEGAGFRGHVTLGPVLDGQRPAVRPVNAAGANGEAFRIGERTAKSSRDWGPRRSVG